MEKLTRKKEGKFITKVFMETLTNVSFAYRLMQNRQSAFRFRIKRKSEFETLKIHVEGLESENDRLR